MRRSASSWLLSIKPLLLLLGHLWIGYRQWLLVLSFGRRIQRLLLLPVWNRRLIALFLVVLWLSLVSMLVVSIRLRRWHRLRLRWRTLFKEFANNLVIIGESSNRVPLCTTHTVVDHCANDMGEENGQQPEYFATASDLVICNTVDQHPYPENGYQDRFKI